MKTSNYNILIVDDEKPIIDMLACALESCNPVKCNITGIYNGRDALKYYKF